MAALLTIVTFSAVGCGSSKPHVQSPAPPPEHALEEAARRAKQAQLEKPGPRKTEVKVVKVKMGEFKAKFVKKKK